MEMSVFELLALARETAGTDYVKGDRIQCEKRYAVDTEHMLEFRILRDHEPYGNPGDHCRLFLTGEAYRRMRKKERQERIRTIHYAMVRGGILVYGPARRAAGFQEGGTLTGWKEKVSLTAASLLVFCFPFQEIS